jgi:hypothetical protein
VRNGRAHFFDGDAQVRACGCEFRLFAGFAGCHVFPLNVNGCLRKMQCF